MMVNESELSLKQQLHSQFPIVTPSAEFSVRIQRQLDQSFNLIQHTDSQNEPEPKLAWVGLRRWTWPLLAAIIVALFASAMGLTIARSHNATPSEIAGPSDLLSSASSAPTSTAETKMGSSRYPIALPAANQREAVCSGPTSKSARFWIIYAAPYPEEYRGTVNVAGANIPALSMYIAGGEQGVGVMCVTNLAKGSTGTPLRAVTAAMERPIAYLDTDYQSVAFAAVDPTIVRVIIIRGAAKSVYSIDQKYDHQLQDIGNGWHAFSIEGGSGAGQLIAKAYDAAGRLRDTRSLADS